MNELIAYLTGLPAETVQAAVGGYLLRLLGALTSIAMVSVCALIGAKVMRIDLRRSIDKVEANPVAFALLVVGHFFSVALIIAMSMG